MKTLIKKAGVVLGVAGIIALGAGNVKAADVEYRNTMTLEKFIGAMEDSSDYRICYAAPQAITSEVATEAEYKNTTNLERFVAALKDQTESEFKNTHNLGSFVAALGETAPEYKNIINLNSFVASLKDSTEREYKNVIDLDRFVASLKDSSGDAKAVEMVCENKATELHANSGMIFTR